MSTATKTRADAPKADSTDDLPPLENGDTLDQPTFHARYEAMPEHVKAELIEGVVYMGSPVSVDHGTPDAIIQAWLVTYASSHPETRICANTTVILDAVKAVRQIVEEISAEFFDVIDELHRSYPA